MLIQFLVYLLQFCHYILCLITPNGLISFYKFFYCYLLGLQQGMELYVCVQPSNFSLDIHVIHFPV